MSRQCVGGRRFLVDGVFPLSSLRRCQPQMQQQGDNCRRRGHTPRHPHTWNIYKLLNFHFHFRFHFNFYKFSLCEDKRIVNCQVRLAYHAPREHLLQSGVHKCVSCESNSSVLKCDLVSISPLYTEVRCHKKEFTCKKSRKVLLELEGL